MSRPKIHAIFAGTCAGSARIMATTAKANAAATPSAILSHRFIMRLFSGTDRAGLAGKRHPPTSPFPQATIVRHFPKFSVLEKSEKQMPRGLNYTLTSAKAALRGSFHSKADST